MFRPFVLDDTGRPFVELVAPDAAAAIIAGQAYVTNGTADAVYFTTDAVAASDGIVGGFRYTTAGALRAYDATAGVPAGSSVNQGIAMTSDGQVCYSTEASGVFFNIAGVAVDSSGRILIDLLTFELLFADLGAGVVSTVEAINGTTPTFTRATVAWTKLASGLWAEVASGSPRSFYGPDGNTVAGSYLGYLAEGARTQLVTPDASIRDMTDAAWVAGATLTVAKTGTGIDGVANSCSRLTGGALEATNDILQTLTAAASSRTYSVWLRRVTGTGTISITQDGGSTWTDVTSSLSTDNFTRVSLTDSVLNAAFGIRVSTLLDEVLADFNQFEAGAFASTPIATAAARNADVLTYPTTGWYDSTKGTSFAEVGPVFWSTSPDTRIFVAGSGDDGISLYIGNGQTPTVITSFDGTGFVTKSGLPSVATAPRKFACSWGDSARAITGSGLTVATGAFDGSMIGGSAVVAVGVGTNGLQAIFGPIRRVAYYAVRLPNTELQALTV